MAKCGNCNAIVNPRWDSCLVCDSPVSATITVKEKKTEDLKKAPEQETTPTQTKFCSWREMAVPAGECNPPCYIYKANECKHLLAWWRKRVNWLEDNRPGLLKPPVAQTKPVVSEPNPEGQILTGHECFDPDGALASLLECARRKGISDAQVASIADDLIRAKSLKAPWGIKIKDAPVLGCYWIVSDTKAKKLIPGNETAFTQEEIGLLSEIREIFGIQNVEVKKR